MEDLETIQMSERRAWIACVVFIASGAFSYWSTEIVDWVNENWKFVGAVGVFAGFTIGQVIRAWIDLKVDRTRRDVERRHLANAFLAELENIDRDIVRSINGLAPHAGVKQAVPRHFAVAY